MSDLISREEALSHPFANGKYDKENANLDYILGFESYKEWLETLPTASILEHARAIKEYCNGKKCDKCPFKSTDPMYICSVSHETPYFWDLPEGEKGGNDDNT